MKTEIRKCTCKHEDQDRRYGNGNRVFNKTTKKKGTESTFFRCTVCGSEQ